jgi:hypothetical protein
MRSVAMKSAVGLAGMLLSAATMAEPLDFTGIGYVQYGDAHSYSLPIACIQSGYSATDHNCPFFVQSSPGLIKDLTVLGTGASGTPVNTNFTGMDNAYPTPSGVNGSTFMQTGGLTFGGNTYPAPDPGGAGQFVGDQGNTWDTTLAALKTFLDGFDMVVFFNNNQENSLGTAAQSLAAWAQVEVTGPGGVRLGIFDFTNMDGSYNLVSEGGGGNFMGNVATYTSTGAGPSGSTNASTDYVLSGGAICVLTGGPVPIPVPCDTPGATGPINHNLGANQAVYALVMPELNALLNTLFMLPDLTGYSMHVDYRLGCDPTLFGTDANAEICSGEALGWGKNLTNGYEQIFIAQMVGITQVPEPATVLLIALGVLSLGWRWRKTARG